MSVADLCERGGYAIQKAGGDTGMGESLYRNLFCVMCNGIDIQDAQCYTSPLTLTPIAPPTALGLRVLMDTSFQSLQEPTAGMIPRDTHNCSSGIYDFICVSIYICVTRDENDNITSDLKVDIF